MLTKNLLLTMTEKTLHPPLFLALLSCPLVWQDQHENARHYIGGRVVVLLLLSGQKRGVIRTAAQLFTITFLFDY